MKSDIAKRDAAISTKGYRTCDLCDFHKQHAEAVAKMRHRAIYDRLMKWKGLPYAHDMTDYFAILCARARIDHHRLSMPSPDALGAHLDEVYGRTDKGERLPENKRECSWWQSVRGYAWLRNRAHDDGSPVPIPQAFIGPAMVEFWGLRHESAEAGEVR